MQENEILYKTILTNCIILLREENTTYFNNEKLANEIGAPLSLIEELDKEYTADLLERMNLDDAVEVLNELDEEDKDELIDLMETEAQELVKKIDSYDEDSVGSYMTDNYIVIKQSSSITTAMSQMVKQAGEHDNIFTLYVVNEKDEYVGAVAIKDLITSRKNDNFDDLIMTSYPYFYDDEVMSDCIDKLKDYAETSLPVLNRKNRIVGVVTQDNIITATEDEFEEDYAKFGGLTEEEETEEPVRLSIKKRIPWLVVLLVLGMVVSSVIGVFEAVIATLPVIVFFQTMILGMSGNVGTQSLAVTIRSLSNSQVEKNRQRKVVLKELKIGFLNGLLIGLCSFILVIIYLAITKQEIIAGNGYLFTDVLMVAGIVGISMLASITLSSVVGTIFPIMLNKMKIDPAVASGPFITTINDVVGVVVYYGLTFLLFMVLL
jgi:magnesium transporter